MKQRYGKDTFLVARPAGSPKLVAKAALHATYEALLRGAGCQDASDEGSTMWFLDVGTDDDEILALASSLGCGVTVLDPEVKDVRAVDMTRCMNEEPHRPFVVFQVPASNITNPESLANLSKPLEAAVEKVNASIQQPQPAFLGLAKPTMLNNKGKKQKIEDQAAPASTFKQKIEERRKLAQANGLINAKPVEVTTVAPQPAPQTTAAPPPPPMESGIMLDTLFTRPGESNASVDVASQTGDHFTMNRIALLKVNPRSETTATLKALQGARSLIESGRVQCLVTEMNFDMNHTETFLNYVGDLEKNGFRFAHLGSLDYSELEITADGQYEVFQTDSQQLKELYDTYKRIRSFDERSGFRVYSGSLSLDRKGHYFDYTDVIFACRNGFPARLGVLAKGKIRFQNGVWWLEKTKP